MGVLGEYPQDEMLARLDRTAEEWQKADPSVPVKKALHLIAVVAQGAPGRDGKYRLRMDSTLIEKVYGWARQKHALLFLDVQVGQSTLQASISACHQRTERMCVRWEGKDVNGRAMSSWRSDGYVIRT